MASAMLKDMTNGQLLDWANSLDVSVTFREGVDAFGSPCVVLGERRHGKRCIELSAGKRFAETSAVSPGEYAIGFSCYGDGCGMGCYRADLDELASLVIRSAVRYGLMDAQPRLF